MGGGASKVAAEDCEVLESRGRVLRVRRHDCGAEGYVPTTLKKKLPALPVFFAEGLVSWWGQASTALAEEPPLGLLPKSSALLGIDFQSDPEDPTGRTFVRFLAEVSAPVAEGLEPSDIFESADLDDEFLAETARLRGDDPVVIVEAWARVPSVLAGRPEFQGEAPAEDPHHLFVPTLVPIEQLRNMWPIPTVLLPAPGPPPMIERSASDILAEADRLYEAGDLEGCLDSYSAAATAAARLTYTVRSRRQQFFGKGSGAMFLRSPAIDDRSIHKAGEGSRWRATDDSPTEGIIKLACGMWLPKASLAVSLTPLEQMPIRALGMAGMLVALLELSDYDRARHVYEQFRDNEKLRDFIERPAVAKALAMYNMSLPSISVVEYWHYYRVRPGCARPAQQPEDLTLEVDDVIAVAPMGMHEGTGWWEGYRSDGSYGCV